MVSKATVTGRVVVVAAGAIAIAAGATVLHTDLLLSRGFGNALETQRPGLSFEGIAAKEPAQAGDEGYWLTRASVESPTPFAKALAVGDRITIAGQDGRQRQLEVVELKALTTSSTRATHPRLLLVTCHVTGEGADGAGLPVRFVVEAEAPVEPAKPAPAKSL